ncbi:MAG: VWA domain-containing protein [Pseudomonadota bacterium]|nr:VWA domain-containing protein [Pseudomonadota bacterium]
MSQKLLMSAAAVALIGGMSIVDTPRVTAQGVPQYDRAVPQVCLPRPVEEDRRMRFGRRTSGMMVRAEAAMEMPPPSPPPPPPPAPPPPASPQPMAQQSAPLVANFARPQPDPMPNRDRFEDVQANPVNVTAETPVSTFSIDVDTASYAVVRNHLHDCELPPSDAVRIEEMVNYFDYEYALPEAADAPFSTSVQVMPTPWNENTQLLHIGVQGYDLIPTERPRANLVFLIDVSGSMNAPDKLPLALQAMHMLVDELDEDDTVSIVVYAGAAGAVLEPTQARHAPQIHEALDSLRAGGSTAGGAGLSLAYSLAEENFDPEAVNRVMLLTDGDFNVGVTQDERLEDFVARKRDSGIYLSVMGFGRGNYNDQMMQTIAQAGNGVAAYIDSRQEARRMLVEETFGSLFTIANDVKIQVEFNPAQVAEYRLIGYETRLLDRADFNNDAVDAGEVGSGHSVTAIYEIAAPGSDGALTDPLRYGNAAPAAHDRSAEFAHLRIRYKLPGEADSTLIERPITPGDAVSRLSDAPVDARFSAQVAGFSQLLRGDPYLQNGYDYDSVLAGVDGASGHQKQCALPRSAPVEASRDR